MATHMHTNVHLDGDVPLSRVVFTKGEPFVSVQIGDGGSFVCVLAPDPADLDRLGEVIARARDELAAALASRAA